MAQDTIFYAVDFNGLTEIASKLGLSYFKGMRLAEEVAEIANDGNEVAIEFCKQSPSFVQIPLIEGYSYDIRYSNFSYREEFGGDMVDISGELYYNERKERFEHEIWDENDKVRALVVWYHKFD